MVVINGRFLSVERPTGTQRVSFSLLCELVAKLSDCRIVCHDTVRFPATIDTKLSSRIEFSNPLRMHQQLWEQFEFPRRCRGQTSLHLMGTGPLFGNPRKTIMFVHDLNYEIISSAFDWRFRLWYKLACGKACQRAAGVVVNSNYTRQQIVDRLKVPSSKINVAHLGPGLPTEVLRAARSNVKQSYFLCVGSLQPHKNLKRVLEAFRLLKLTKPNVELRIVGKRQAFFNSIDIPQDLVEQSGVSFTGYLSDAELACHYGSAFGLVFPSLEEGFGMPIVEAFYAGCPVITSNRSCLPEIAGDSALLVDPDSPQEICHAMLELLNPDISQNLVSRGLARSSHFCWSNAGDVVVDTIKKVESGQK